MSDRILDRYTGRNGDGSDSIPPPAAEPDAPENFGSFGWLRGIRDRATMLQLRQKNGNVVAIGYGWLERCEFDPSEGITLYAVGRTIRIRGRNLNAEVRPIIRLFDGICRHRVLWLQEADEPTLMAADKDATVIEGIEW